MRTCRCHAYQPGATVPRGNRWFSVRGWSSGQPIRSRGSMPGVQRCGGWSAAISDDLALGRESPANKAAVPVRWRKSYLTLSDRRGAFDWRAARPSLPPPLGTNHLGLHISEEPIFTLLGMGGRTAISTGGSRRTRRSWRCRLRRGGAGCFDPWSRRSRPAWWHGRQPPDLASPGADFRRHDVYCSYARCLNTRLVACRLRDHSVPRIGGNHRIIGLACVAAPRRARSRAERGTRLVVQGTLWR